MLVSNVRFARQILSGISVPTAAGAVGAATSAAAPRDSVSFSSTSVALFDALRSGTANGVAAAGERSVRAGAAVQRAGTASNAYLFVDRGRTETGTRATDGATRVARSSQPVRETGADAGTSQPRDKVQDKPAANEGPAASNANGSAQPAAPAPAPAQQPAESTPAQSSGSAASQPHPATASGTNQGAAGSGTSGAGNAGGSSAPSGSGGSTPAGQSSSSNGASQSQPTSTGSGGSPSSSASGSAGSSGGAGSTGSAPSGGSTPSSQPSGGSAGSQPAPSGSGSTPYAQANKPAPPPKKVFGLF